MNTPLASEIISRTWLHNLMRDAGDLTLQYFGKKLRTSEKPLQQGIVTEADLATEHLLKQRITECYPESQFLAEESTAPEEWLESGLSPETRKKLQRDPKTLVWVIDPIDGTTNFSMGNPYYCVSVCAGQVSPQGNFAPLMGCILQPATGDLYSAVHGQGATYNGEPISPRPSAASPLVLKSAAIATGFGYLKGPPARAVMDALLEIQLGSRGVRINGAAALDLAMTARGVFDGFFEYRLMPWDLAAGALIAREAGLAVRTLTRPSYETFEDNNIVVCQPSLLDEVMTILSKTLGP